MSLDPEAARENWQRLLHVWLNLQNDQRDTLLEIGNSIKSIGPNGMQILNMVAARLALGAARYGDFDKPRDMRAEGLEEIFDGLVYLGRSLIKQTEVPGG